MKNLRLVVIILATLITVTSCEKDTVNPSAEQPENRQPLSLDLISETTLSLKDISNPPQTIEELREAGIEVSEGLASFVRDLRTLLYASEIAVENSERLLSYGFYPSEIVELKRINKEYAALIESLSTTSPEPTTPVEPTNPTEPTPPSEPTPPAEPASKGYEQEILALVNQARAEQGLNPVTLNAELNKAAFDHSKDMVDNNYFDHTSQDGSSPWDRIGRTNYKGSARAENIAAGQTTSKQVHDAWMSSPGHRKNILTKDINEMGIGRFGNTWTQVFGTSK